MPTRNELVKAMAAEIRRYATVAGIKRQALGLVPIADESNLPRESLISLADLGPTNKPLRERSRQKKPPAVLIIPARYARLLQSCVCLRAR
jgi:hypothetical protein